MAKCFNDLSDQKKVFFEDILFRKGNFDDTELQQAKDAEDIQGIAEIINSIYSGHSAKKAEAIISEIRRLLEPEKTDKSNDWPLKNMADS